MRYENYTKIRGTSAEKASYELILTTLNDANRQKKYTTKVETFRTSSNILALIYVTP